MIKLDKMALLQALEPAVRAAGDVIMEVYSRGPVADTKQDGSPVTEADRAAERILLLAIGEHAQGITIISEENESSHSAAAPKQFFLVDPLDGTKEFLKGDGKGSFTVNVALVENGAAVLGIVLAPALKRYFSGIEGAGAWEDGSPISVRAIPENGPVAVASVSHRDLKTDTWLEERGVAETVAVGSSLKFCLMASGEADLYPRFSRTMEWDTAAGQAILVAAGGRVEDFDGEAFGYGKAGFENGPFVALGGC